MDLIPITSLIPEHAPPANKSVRGIVTLSWPYSSSTRQCALLLADSDFRLRNRKGQVRVRFTGASAEAVAKAHVGIGDEVVLALEGASWEQDSEATRTPGKSVDGELMFRRRLVLNVTRDGEHVDINVDAPVSPAMSPRKAVEVVTPLPKAVAMLRPNLDDRVESLPNYTYASPAFAKRLRLSGESFLNSDYDPFAVDDIEREYLGEGQRTSFGTGLKWRYSEKSPSPKKDHFSGNEVNVEESSERQHSAHSLRPEVESPSKEARPKTKMLPPPLPHLQMPTAGSLDNRATPEEAIVEQHEGPTTPEIRPVQSPTLPMPSPFPTETRQAQFGLVDATMPLQIQDSSFRTLVQQPIEERSDALMDDITRGQDVETVDQNAETTDTGLHEYLSDTEPDDELTQQALLERHGVIVYGGTTIKDRQAEGVDGTSQVLPRGDSEQVFDMASFDRSRESIRVLPRTPDKATVVPSRFNLGLDGASSAPTSAHVTPQSEKEKIMAQTYRSLFGFPESSASASQSSHPQVRAGELQSSTQTAWFSDMTRSRLDADRASTKRKERDNFTENVKDIASFAQENRTSALKEQQQALSGGHSLGALQQQSQESKRQRLSPTRPPEVEVIDLASSTESEDDHPQEAASVPSVPQRQGPEFEVQDSLADSRGEEVVAQDSEAPHGHPGIRERRVQASRLQEMIGLIPPEMTGNDASQPILSMEVETGPQKYQDIDTAMEDVSNDKPESASEILPSLPRTSPTVIEIELSSPLQPLETDLTSGKADDPDIPADTTETNKLDDVVSVGIQGASNKQTQSEIEVKSRVPNTETPVDSVPAEMLKPALTWRQQTMEAPVYPSLPLSPSNSQSLPEMLSQEAAGTIPETLTSVLPPTPQLTQEESFRQAHARASQLASSSGLEMHQPSAQIQETAEEEPNSQSQIKTPSNSQLLGSAEENLSSKSQKRTPAKKSPGNRVSNVPDVISTWFSPKRSSLTAAQETEERERMDVEDESMVASPGMQQVRRTSHATVNGHVLAHSEQLQPSGVDTNGFSTSLSYFTPLSRLEELLNPSSQQAHGTSTVDVLAVITDRMEEPVRAKRGPRDYFTIFKISDHSLAAQSDVGVEIYRPWMATLPVGSVGDVILLRGFAVKSRKRQPYLLSTDSSAWCVWRYEDQVSGQHNDRRPIWAQKRRSFNDSIREEIKGPPVELGDEERDKASRLRAWWQTVQSEYGQNGDLNDMPNGEGLSRHVHGPVAARL